MQKKINFWRVSSEKKIKEAALLVGREYKKDGYFSGEENDFKVPFYHFFSTSSVFLTEVEGNNIATVSMIGDSGKGIPMEAIYRKEIKELRKKNRKIAEISQLAIARDFMKKIGRKKRCLQYPILISLFRLIFYNALSSDIDTLYIAINPKHDVFYKALGFSEIGSLKYYSNVEGAPALARAFFIEKDFSKFSQKNSLLKEISKNPIKESAFKKKNDEIIFSLPLA